MIEKISLSLLTVIAFFTWGLFLSNAYLHTSLTGLNSLFILTLTIFFVYMFLWRKFQITEVKKEVRLYGSEKIILPLLIGVVITNVLLNWYFLPLEFDSVTMYDFRAKVFSQSHNIQEIEGIYYGSFPLFTSLGHTVLYIWGFNNPKIFYSIMLILFLFLFYSKLNQKIGRRGALIGCLLTATIPVVFAYTRTAYLNFPYLVYLGVSLIYLTEYLKDNKKQNLVIFSLFIALASWVRAAHHPIFAVNLLIVFFWGIKTKSYKDFLVPLLFYVGVFGPWYYYQYFVLKLTTYESTNFRAALKSGVPIFAPAIVVIKRLIDSLLDIKFAGGVGIIFLATTFFQIYKNKGLGDLNVNYIVLLVNFSGWIGLCLLTQTAFPYDLWVTVLRGSMTMILIVFFPLMVYTMLQLPIFMKLWIKK